ncbi:MAG TPA: hypothetical protein DCE41_06910 [Cytophagales bacterium]|nr:hypothetical protein [Cytophagales bacterium]HAA19641.1 hypothetical protein [Cytophagales bacterium]HAP60228.1 hypothetical protein [Cytophagales bacterium]
MSGKRTITIRFVAKDGNDPSEFIGRVAARLPDEELNFEMMESTKSATSTNAQNSYTEPLQKALEAEPTTPLKGNKNERAEAEWVEKVDYVEEIQSQGGRVSGKVVE